MSQPITKSRHTGRNKPLTEEDRPETFLAYLKAPKPSGLGYTECKDLGDGTYLAVYPLLFHWTMVRGVIGDRESYFDRWCYATQELADQAFDLWDGAEGTEPVGWHRHPMTDRRKEVHVAILEILEVKNAAKN